MSNKRPNDTENKLAKKLAQKEKTLIIVTKMVSKFRTDPNDLTPEEMELVKEIKTLKGTLSKKHKIDDLFKVEIIEDEEKEEEDKVEVEIIDDEDDQGEIIDDEDDHVEIIDEHVEIIDDEDDQDYGYDEDDVEVEIVDHEKDELITPFAKQLLRDGYTVIPVYTSDETKEKRKRFHHTLMHEMPEYKHNKATKEVNTFKGEHYFHKGGFGALGNPSSFHNLFVREIRMDAMKVAKKLFDRVRQIDPTLKNHKLEQIIDRMRVLRKKAELTAESWHRDTTPLFNKSKGFGAEADDKIYGGWIAFDGPQKFSAVKQTHTTNDLVPTGFSKLSKEDQVKLTKEKEKIIKEKGEKDWYIYVPAGHMLIFQQEMIHEVEKGNKREEPSYRLFTGWRLTKSKNPLMQNQEEFFSKQTVPLIKSSQEADMWPQAAWSTQAAMKTLQDWSEATFNPLFLYNKAVQGGEFSGVTWHVIPRYMYGMYDVARKLAAKFVRNTMKEADEEIPEIIKDAIKMHPDQWKKRWNDQDLERMTGINDEFIRSFMFRPYSEEEKRLYKPVN